MGGGVGNAVARADDGGKRMAQLQVVGSALSGGDAVDTKQGVTALPSSWKGRYTCVQVACVPGSARAGNTWPA